MDKREREFIRQVVRETIAELAAKGLLRDNKDALYAEAAASLRAYYADGQKDETVRKAVEALKGDRYFKIIPLYFYYGYTNEEVAEALECDTTTVVRNKKRLCLEIYSCL